MVLKKGVRGRAIAARLRELAFSIAGTTQQQQKADTCLCHLLSWDCVHGNFFSHPTYRLFTIGSQLLLPLPSALLLLLLLLLLLPLDVLGDVFEIFAVRYRVSPRDRVSRC